jgi:hypothetical protein
MNFKYAYTLVDFWHITSLISLTSPRIFWLKIAALNINFIESVIAGRSQWTRENNYVM